MVAPPEFVAAIRRICDEHGIVMIADEVQSGFARTGQLFAMDHYADKADLMTMAKSLAGGMPLSGVVGKAEIMDAPAPGGLGEPTPETRCRSRRPMRCWISFVMSSYASVRRLSVNSCALL